MYIRVASKILNNDFPSLKEILLNFRPGTILWKTNRSFFKIFDIFFIFPQRPNLEEAFVAKYVSKYTSNSQKFVKILEILIFVKLYLKMNKMFVKARNIVTLKFGVRPNVKLVNLQTFIRTHIFST